MTLTTTAKAGATIAAATALTVLTPAVASADPTISLEGDIVITAKRTLDVPITATCDPVGQDTSFIDLVVTQGSYGEPGYIEGQGAVTALTCDSERHVYHVAVKVDRGRFGQGTWQPGTAALTGILSYCFRDVGDTLSCTTQAHIANGTLVSIRR